MSELYCYFDPRVSRYREYRTGKFCRAPPEVVEVPPKPLKMWRYTIAINAFSLHWKRYPSVAAQVFTFDKEVNDYLRITTDRIFFDYIRNMLPALDFHQEYIDSMLIGWEDWEEVPYDPDAPLGEPYVRREE